MPERKVIFKLKKNVFFNKVLFTPLFLTFLAVRADVGLLR